MDKIKWIWVCFLILAGTTSVPKPAEAGWVDDLMNRGINSVIQNRKPIYDHTVGGMLEQHWFGNVSAQETQAVREHYREKSDAELFRRCANMASDKGLMPAGLYPSAYALIVARSARDGQSTDCYKRAAR